MSNRKHILMLIYGSVRDDPRIINEGHSLVNAGYDVTVIGAPREGYATEQSTTKIHNMTVVLVPILPEISIGHVARLLRNLIAGNIGDKTVHVPQRRAALRTFVNIIIFWLWVIRLAWADRYDAVHSHDVIPLPVTWLLARRYAGAFVYDSHVAWEYVYQHESGLKNTLFNLINRFFIPKADVIIINSTPLGHELKQLGAGNIVSVANYKRLDEYNIDTETVEELRQSLELESYAVEISYIGLLFDSRGVVELANVVAQDPDVALIIAGRGDVVDDIERIAETAPNIFWLGWLNLKDVPRYTAASDVIYCWLPDIQPYQFSTPNKLFDAIAMGRAMIVQQGVGEMSDLVAEHDFGQLVADNSEEALSKAITALKNVETLTAMK